MNWDKIITENRTIIDEFIGTNQDKYIQIHLKGQLTKKIGKEKAFSYFEEWEKLGLAPKEQNKQMRTILEL